MKLVFPGGEHPQVLLGQGINRIGSDPGATVVLDQPGVLPQHCELHVNDHGVMLHVPKGAPLQVNGRNVDGLIALRPGDSVNFDSILARLASLDTVAPGSRQVGTLPAPANDDPGATSVRQALPRYVLRGVSGEGKGRSYPVGGSVVVGRASECGLHLRETGLSRKHARLIPTDDGIQLEDLGSTNGSFINGKRVQRGLAKPGDEVGFDMLRFKVAMPGQALEAEPAVQRRWPARTWLWAGIAIILAGVAAAWWLGALG